MKGIRNLSWKIVYAALAIAALAIASGAPVGGSGF